MNFDEQVNRNIKGIEFEKTGNIAEAIKLYEANIAEEFEGNHPYDRLAILYHKQGLISEERRVLEKAIYVFETKVHKDRGDKSPKLERFKARLSKI